MAISWDDVAFGFRPASWLWKPLVWRYLTGSWSRLRMRPGEIAFPADLKHVGLYLHVPFCRRPCVYCPYNRVKYDESRYRLYEIAAHQEIDLIARRLTDVASQAGGESPTNTSLYVGGGTPTIEPASLAELLTHVGEALGRARDICVELHPAAMDDPCLETLKAMGVSMVSVGAESLSDRLLELIGRSHDADTAERSIQRAVAHGFDTVSADLMFGLPTQTLDELDRDLTRVFSFGVDQISSYPLFGFPYTDLGRKLGIKQIRRPRGDLMRKMLDLIRRRACEYGLVQSSVWSFVRPERKKFTSTTRHHYLGIGPSAGSMIPGQFHVNTFSIEEYAAALPDRLPVALTMPIDRRLEMAYWLYWRAYELTISGQGFQELFDDDLESVYGRLLRLLKRFGMLRQENGCYHVTEDASYWIHRVQNEYALNYINRLWGRCRERAWPQEVRL